MRPLARRSGLACLDLHAEARRELKFETVQAQQERKVVIGSAHKTSYQDVMLTAILQLPVRISRACRRPIADGARIMADAVSR
jgi:hypothetical protein